ncbi:MAG: hypothetical protein MI784_06055, partial [Cytophagales bacterium]|nr:hypothetical protein [Cytophagales bacterium]
SNQISLSYNISRALSSKRGKTLSLNSAVPHSAETGYERLIAKEREKLDFQQQALLLREEKMNEKESLIEEQRAKIKELKAQIKSDRAEWGKQYKEKNEIVRETGSANYYTVIAVFGKLRYAKDYQQILRREQKAETFVVASDSVGKRQYYFVSTKTCKTWEEAQKEINRLSSSEWKQFLEGNPWIYAKKKES